jgi:hypothetical protein
MPSTSSTYSAVNDYLDTRTGNGRIVLKMQVVIGQCERETIAYKQSRALVYKTKSNMRVAGYLLRHNLAFELWFRAIREGWLDRVFELTVSKRKLVDSDIHFQALTESSLPQTFLGWEIEALAGDFGAGSSLEVIWTPAKENSSSK